MQQIGEPIDVILFGGSGITGRLVAEVLAARASEGAGFSWALAGRSAARLAEVRTAIEAPASLPLLTADATDAGALAALLQRTRVVISTVGPYTLHGTALATACAEAGTDDVDLCGEPLWMVQMIHQLQASAAASGARIVFSKNVLRSDALRVHPWGRDFAYAERLRTGPGWAPHASCWAAWPCRSPARAPAAASVKPAATTCCSAARPWMAARCAPRCKRSVTRATAPPRTCSARPRCACLQDMPRQATPGGVWTPGSAMGLALVRRLQDHAGLRFEMED